MPTLPGKDLSQQHFDRVVAAFPGDTPAEKAASYDAWLTNHLIDYVAAVEEAAIRREQDEELQQRLMQLRDSLPERLPFVVGFVDLTPPPVIAPPPA